MKVADFDYDLPETLIAQEPAPRRDASRLLALDRTSGQMTHRRFTDLPDLLAPRDLLVLNDTRVLPARLLGHKPTGGRVELLLLEPIREAGDPCRWRSLVRASKTPALGTVVDLGQGMQANLAARDGDCWEVVFEDSAGDPHAKIGRLGQMPLPPYIRRAESDLRTETDRDRYQTVYARQPGAVAAPTAGLHFTPEVLARLETRGIDVAFVTLHVGLGTFQPVRTDEVEGHRMHSEAYELPASTATAFDEARARGGRVVAVGTTVVRVLEDRAAGGSVRAGRGRCDLFVYPGFEFQAVDAILTNFHLPRSTLLMLVCAFGGRGHVLGAYREAVAQQYRFYSYGDAMVIGSFV